MKKMILLAALVSMSAFSAFASAPYDCVGARNPEHAFLENVLQAMRDAHVKGVKLGDIKRTVNDNHNPEYDVTALSGQVFHVTCDDSGDDQCECELAQ